MAGKFIKIGNPHYCERPDLYKWKNRKITIGTQWQCDDCNAIYEVVFHGGVDIRSYWTKISGHSEDAS